MIGSHNTMTYLPVKRWYMKLFNCIAKCQDLNLIQQYNYGVRLFDLRISYNKYGIPEFAHGLVKYKGDVLHTLKYINTYFKGCTVRIILESEKNNGVKLFRDNVLDWINFFNDITFIQGNSKKNWNKIVNLPDFTGPQYVSSMCGKGLARIFPRLYAYLYNSVNKELTTTEYLIDFVGKYD